MSNRRFWVLVLTGLALVTLVIGVAINTYLVDKRIERAAERLLLLGSLRRDALERYLDTARAELVFWSANEFLLEQQAWIVTAWQEAVAAGRAPASYLQQMYTGDKPSFPDQEQTGNAAIYSEMHALLHPMAKRFVTERGYHDFFLISPGGDVHYSVEKEDDFATNLVSGPYRNSGLGDAFRQVIAAPESGTIGLSDLQAYMPSGGAPAMFIAEAMHDGAGNFIGVIAFQVPTEKIQSIMHFTEGMSDTGEAYLVGQDYLMRSDSRFSQESTVLKQRVDTATVQRALRGESGVAFTTDYRNVEVLSAYASLSIGETAWAIMTEVDKAEIIGNATSEQPMIAAFMLFLYSLGIWSIWFIQRSEPAGTGGDLLVDMEMDSGTDLLDG